MKIIEYAVINEPVQSAPWNNHKVEFESQNVEEIVWYLIATQATDAHECIEIYSVDEDGEFVDGSDFDTVSNFLKRYKAGLL